MMLQQSSGLVTESFRYEVRNTFIHTKEKDNSAITCARSKSSPALLFEGKTQFCTSNSKEGHTIPDFDDEGILDRLIKELQTPPEDENVPQSLLSSVARPGGQAQQDFAMPPPRLDKKWFSSVASTTASEADHSQVQFERAMPWPCRQRGLHGQWLRDKTMQKVVDESCSVGLPFGGNRLSHGVFRSAPAASRMAAFKNFGQGETDNSEIIPQDCNAGAWDSTYPMSQSMVCMVPVHGNPALVSCLPFQVPPVAPVRPSNKQQYFSEGPAFGNLHHFHMESRGTGELSEDCRTFTKREYQGRLSVITEAEMHSSGISRHIIQFTKGELSAADGVGFVFSRTLPCPKNIKRITSMFVNRSGRICLRGGSNVVRSNTSVSKLRVGDWIEMTVDLEKMVASFVVWPASGMCPSSAVFAFGSALNDLNIQVSRPGQPVCGYLACVVQNLGVTMAIRS